ncbi:MAG TPA: hypothetical protein VEC19_13280 [Usitatibacter sp.]|nr:hypothetical protein [Usitatibacter sp.]
MPRLPAAGVFFALFTLSGFAGLIYQSIWSHYLKLFLGHAAYAQTLVLAIFMGGMALGAWLVARFTGRIRNLLMGYAVAELGIGLLALVFHRVFQAATGWAYDSVLPVLAGSGVDAFKWSLATVLILPASVLLGTTFPLMSAGILRAYPDQGGRALSMLYFTNSFGAAAGVLASGFFLIGRFGLPGTILTAGLLNILLAMMVWVIVKRMPPQAGETRLASHDSARPVDLRYRRAILALAAITGVASFIYEVTWIRMLTLGLGASTHAFEVMIAAFILAMSLGAFWFRNRIARIADHTAWLTGLMVAKAAFAAYAVWIYPDVLSFVGWMMRAVARTDAGYVLFTSAGLAASMLLMFPTAFCAGMTLPLATHALTSRGHGEASIGRVYAANTAGCIVGAAFATHVGMEALGVKGLTAAGAALDVFAALLLMFAGMAAVRRKAALASVALAGVASVALFAGAELDLLRMASGVYRDGAFMDPATERVLFYRDGKTATVAVTQQGPRIGIRTNGKPDASIQYGEQVPAALDEMTMVLAAALPIAMRPEIASIAVIGFGSGLSTHVALGSPRVREVDTIEIEPMMIEGAKLFAPRNDRAYSDPRSKLHIEDAKTFFATRGRRYDVILSEPSNPWVSGVSTLFSEEFYAHTRRHLAEDGLLVQWIQAYEIDLDLIASIFKALAPHYRDYAVYNNRYDLVVVATPAARLPPIRDEIFSYPGLAADLAHLGVRSRAELEAMRLGGRALLEPLWAQSGYPANSDFFPVLDQNAPRARFESRTVEEFTSMREAAVPVVAMLDRDDRLSLQKLGAPSLNRPYPAWHALIAAEAVGLALGGPADAARLLKPEDRQAAALFARLAADCPGARAEWVNAFARILRLATPYLDAEHIEPLLRKARASPCMKSQDDRGARRVALLEAIHARDGRAMGEHAAWLLHGPGPDLELDRGMLVIAALAGAVASSDRALARAIVREQLPGLPRKEREAPLMRLLLGHYFRAEAKGS